MVVCPCNHLLGQELYAQLTLGILGVWAPCPAFLWLGYSAIHAELFPQMMLAICKCARVWDSVLFSAEQNPRALVTFFCFCRTPFGAASPGRPPSTVQGKPCCGKCLQYALLVRPGAAQTARNAASDLLHDRLEGQGCRVAAV